MQYHKIPENERDEVRTRAADIIKDAFTSCDVHPHVIVIFEEQLWGDNEMWYAWITFDRPLNPLQMRDVCEGFTQFADDLEFTVGGRKYFIGDGERCLICVVHRWHDSCMGALPQ